MATRKMNFKKLRFHIDQVCQLIDASDQGMQDETADDGVLNLGGPESDVVGAANDARPSRGQSMSQAFPNYSRIKERM